MAGCWRIGTFNRLRLRQFILRLIFISGCFCFRGRRLFILFVSFVPPIPRGLKLFWISDPAHFSFEFIVLLLKIKYLLISVALSLTKVFFVDVLLLHEFDNVQVITLVR